MAVSPYPAIEAFSVVSELARSRSAIYGFLSLAFAGPLAPAELEALRSPVFLEGFGALLDGSDETAFLSLTTLPEPELALGLGCEFTRLFRAPGPGYVPPYESVYRDEWVIPGLKRVRGLLWGESTVAVQKTYREAGFPHDKVGKVGSEPPDHIALEFGFAAFCAAGEVDPSHGKEWSDRRRRFLDEHLLAWAPGFLTRVRHASPDGLYGLIAGVAAGFLEDEAKGEHASK
ncbi:MAG: molecular chaperone TorD family protein [Firmicutes bacterium]|nr:molecular chaperone TorD family protein [Bacillota bacterium]